MGYRLPRCEIVPLPDRRVAFRIDGTEKTRWHFAETAPRPFFYPLLGPAGETLTRMGHPGAQNHDHHRSVWFAHHKVLGIDFWSDRTEARIRQQHWFAYRDGDDEAVMAVMLGWYDGHNPKELLRQELVAAVRPLEGSEWELEVQARFLPTADSLEFGQTNFGFFAVRVAKSISMHFGGGTITSNHGRGGEEPNFGKPATWMDYSGPVRTGESAKTTTEGITYFDHPVNPGHPLSWHVREDGWMGASVCRHQPVTTTKKSPLVIRHLLHIHAGELNIRQAENRFAAFSRRPGFEVIKSRKRHRQYEVRRVSAGS